MPSALHESMIELFRVDPHLIEALAGPLLGLSPGDLGALSTEDANLSDARPVERRADLAIVSERGLAFVIEAQLSVDSDKRWTWPAYAVLARDRFRHEVVLVVLTLNPTVADWAKSPILLDPLGSRLCPLVIGPAQIPLVSDVATACAHPEQLVLSALAHGKGPDGLALARAAAAAAPLLDEDRGRFNMDHISDALGPVARAALEAAMFENYEYRSELFRSLVNQGRAEGEAQGVVRGKIEGKIEGRIEGKIEGEVLGLRTAIVEVLRRRQIPIDAPAQNQLAVVTDAPTLMRFLNRAVTASTLDEVLKD